MTTITTLVIAVSAVNAQETSRFDIDAGPAKQALNEYAQQARIELGFQIEEIRDTRTNAVKGNYAAGDALDVLLAGTGLVARNDGDGVIVRLARPLLAQPESDEATKGSKNLSSAKRPHPRSAAGRTQDIDQEAEMPDRILEEILVTGSRIRGAAGASPVVTITRQEIDRAGFATVEEVVDNLPQNFGGGAGQDTVKDGRASHTVVGGAVGSITAGSSVNLRGLGTSSTLVLVNGRRVGSSGADAKFVDISSIPLSAIERVEVLTDGASAIYGADAIAGVVNFILRKDYDGSETRLRYASDTGGDTSETLLSQTIGRSWSSGNTLFSYEYYKHANLANVDRKVAASSDLRRFGGDDWRSIGGNPANIIAGGQSFAIPEGQDGRGLTPADFVGHAGVSNRHDIRANEDFLPEQERHSLFVSASQEVRDTELYGDFRFSRRSNRTLGDQGLRDLNVPATNPFFVDPTAGGLDTIRVQGYSLQEDLGPFVNSGQTSVYSGVIGAGFDLPKAWQGELTGTYSQETAESTFKNFVNTIALDAALAQTDPNLAFNPFGDGPHTSPSVIDDITTSGNGSYARNTLWTVGLTVNGDAIEVGGGAVKVAAGVEFRKESLSTHSIVGHDAEAPRVSPGTDQSRDVTAVYAELLFPLLGDASGREGVHALVASVAGRFEDYSDFGHSVDPKMGLMWKVDDSLTLRGTFGTSFKAPGLADLDTSDLRSNLFFYYPLPIIPVETIFLLGGNEDLAAETATTWTAGFRFSPSRLDALSIEVTYFKVDFSDRIELPFGDIRQAFDSRFSTLRTLDPTTEEIAAVLNDRRYTNIFGVPDADLLSGSAPVGAIVDGRINNLAQSVAAGVDFQLKYHFESSVGDFAIDLNGNYLFDFERSLIASDPLVEEVDTLGRPVDFRARGGITWNHMGWTASGFLNYTDDYTDNLSIPHRPIESWTTVDTSLSYQFGTKGVSQRSTRVSLSVQNVFDEEPPFANSPGGLAYDSANANGRGRFAALQLSRSW